MSDQAAGGLWPLVDADPLPATGALIGVDWDAGAAFHADPIGWTLAGTAGVTNPNVIVFGAPGRGKSATVKLLSLRMMAYGYRTLVLGDVKDEYEPLCRALGVTPHAVGPGLSARINPLDVGPAAADGVRLTDVDARQAAALAFARWTQLVKGLVGSQHVAFTPTFETAVTHVIRDATGHADGGTRLAPVTIPDLWHALGNPTPRLVQACRYARRQAFLDGTRELRDALGALVTGHLAGLFDAPTTISVDWRAPIQSLSLSRLEPLGDEAIGIALTCLNSWGRAMTTPAGTHTGTHTGSGSEPGPDLLIVVRDEAWKQMRLGTGAVASLDADLRLSRRDGCIQVVVAHKPSDMLTVGDAGSQAVAIARDLIHLCATRVLLGQDDKVAADLTDLLGLPPLAHAAVTGWATGGPGRALWAVGDRHIKVQAVPTALELSLTDTNTAITLRPSGRGDQR